MARIREGKVAGEIEKLESVLLVQFGCRWWLMDRKTSRAWSAWSGSRCLRLMEEEEQGGEGRVGGGKERS